MLWLLVRDGRFNETEPPRRRLPKGVNVISVVKRHLSGRGVARVGGWWLEIASWPVFVGKDRLPSREIRAQFTCYNQSARPVSLCWRKLQPVPDQVVGVDGRRHLAE